MDNQTRCSAFVEWKNTNDISVLFIKHYYLTIGKRINVDAYSPQELYDGLKSVAKKVYRGKLKEGDIVFIKSNTDTYIKTGLFIKEVEKDVSFLSLEVKIVAGQIVLNESLRLYTETCFLRPSEEEEEIVEKKSKKK